ncbi:sugar kinase [Serpentinicella alkaliphila]|uniref:2-dehydro-3-deoxygluconokinase n=1 Tax=Serpentinicella alkaliphila TaxID=1734049 RepID=A0A4R2UCT7_9FIRM|nr:sugar kinase [Serpentinicella alkaliphila]QUH26860.1 sugar kinase [Serpentinicella alkaliphila]TCQ08089.1 2-dehydro-3-deoxygluconokinase [Serpentinicella alkaliphila]
MSRVICFGEIMGRLCPPGFKKVVQTNLFELTFAGGEANVAVSLANYGIDSSFVTKVPDNDMGKSVIRVLKSYGVDTSNVLVGGERLGMYYVEKGASQRPSKVIYDRKYSSISMAESGEFKWNSILDGVEWFHVTGITPALSDNCIEITLEALKICKEKGIKVSCDLNYRKNLWSEKKAKQVMTSLMEYVDVCIANEEDAEKVFGIKSNDTDVVGGKINKDGYILVAKEIEERFGCKTIAITLRESYSASVNGWSAMIYTGGNAYFSKKYDIQLVDRVGGGDSFVGGLLYGLLEIDNPQEVVEFAVAASCLKHTIEGDFNQVSIKDVKALMAGDGSGRVQR